MLFRSLSFYLSHARRYLDDLQDLARRHPPAEALTLENALLGRNVRLGGL